jgi:hypothetical protein
VTGGEFITATATDSLGSTSEFSAHTLANMVPGVIAAIPDTTISKNTLPINDYCDLNEIFTDFEDGSALNFVIQHNSDPSLVTATMDVDSSLDLNVAPNRTGSVSIVVRATDSGSLSVEDTFVVTVIPAPEITITTDPVGLVVAVDSVAYAGPQDFVLETGSNHRIAVDSPQQNGDTLFLFSNWSDGGTIAHDIVIPDTNITYTAHFDTRFTYPVIDSLIDVPDDQGGWVNMHFMRSGFDRTDEAVNPITLYEIYGLVTDPLVIDNVLTKGIRIREEAGPSNAPMAGTYSQSDSEESTLRYHYDGRDFHVVSADSAAVSPDVWELLGNVGAEQQDRYVQTVPTESDSSSGTPYSVYYISARTADPFVFFNSPIDSGVSVDNIPPSAPVGFSVVRGAGDKNFLSWEASQDDALTFRVYRSTNPGLTPNEANLVFEAVGTEWVDAISDSWKYHYKITALDEMGNESTASEPEALGTAGPVVVPARFRLHQNTPNPFNPTTVIRYDVPAAGGNVTLRIYDVAGRLIRTLVDGAQTSGQKSVTWQATDDLGSRVGSGVYFYHLRAPGFSETRKMVLVQ